MPGAHSARPETIAIHADRGLNDGSTDLAPAIHQTSTFSSRSAGDYLKNASEPMNDRFYTRNGNPNHTQAAAVIAALEGAQTGMIFPSGLAALTAAFLTFAKSGDHVIAQRSMYAGTQNMLQDVLEPLGIACTLVDQTDPGAFRISLRDTTRMIAVETPSNPLLGITDLSAVANLARDRGIITIADNTFATPINQRPLDFGIDIAMHSATKYLGGHSDLSAGVLVSTRAIIEKIWNVSVKLGFAVNGFDSWLLLRGLRTLPLRVQRQSENALAIARFLRGRDDIAAVHYPGLQDSPGHALAASQMRGFGGVLSFALRGGVERVEPFIQGLKLITRASSLGGVESTLVHQSAMWAAVMDDAQLGAAGISPTLIRLSSGIEHIDDLTADLKSALQASS